MTLVEQVVVELQALFIRLQLVPFRKNPGPGNRRPEYFKAHFRKQLNIFFISVIEIDTNQLHVIVGRNFCRRRLNAMRHDILGRPAFAIILICPFKLVSGYSPTP
ncbi:hypothetical protein D3C75_560390 [compost metagenome]